MTNRVNETTDKNEFKENDLSLFMNSRQKKNKERTAFGKQISLEQNPFTIFRIRNHNLFRIC